MSPISVCFPAFKLGKPTCQRMENDFLQGRKVQGSKKTLWQDQPYGMGFPFRITTVCIAILRKGNIHCTFAVPQMSILKFSE